MGNSRDEICTSCIGSEELEQEGNEFLSALKWIPLKNLSNNNLAVLGNPENPIIFGYYPPPNLTLFLTGLVFFAKEGKAFAYTNFCSKNALPLGMEIRVNGNTLITLKNNIDLRCFFNKLFPNMGSAATPADSLGGLVNLYEAAGDRYLEVRKRGEVNGSIEVLVRDDQTDTGLIINIWAVGMLRRNIRE